MRIPSFLVAVFLVTSVCPAKDFSRDQRLIVACYKLDVEGVVAALRDGADVNARFGIHDTTVFKDPWTTGLPMAATQWTPLLALANASDFPDPPRRFAAADHDRAMKARAQVPTEQIEARRRDGMTIALILMSHRPSLDLDDGRGATALFDAISSGKLELAKLLIRHDAEVNTKTGIYIDGPGDITPLHRAFWSAELTKLLLEKGADPNAKDTDGRTPRDWVDLMSGPPKPPRD